MTERNTNQSVIFAADETSAVVRYQVHDVDRALNFYTKQLDFRVERRPAPIIAIVARGDLHLILSGPDASGSRPMPGGQQQEPGGWNRIVLYVDNLESKIASLEATGIKFRNQVEVGPGGKQIQITDPDGNPIELHEAPQQTRQ